MSIIDLSLKEIYDLAKEVLENNGYGTEKKLTINLVEF